MNKPELELGIVLVYSKDIDNKDGPERAQGTRQEAAFFVASTSALAFRFLSCLSFYPDFLWQ